MATIIAYKALSFMSLKKGIGLYGGLFQVTILNHSFQIFIFLISSIIIQLTGFYPIKFEISNNLNTRLLSFIDSFTSSVTFNIRSERIREQFKNNRISFNIIIYNNRSCIFSK
jgi:hypothetical protein